MKDHKERSKVSFKMIFPVLLLWIAVGAGCAQKAPDIRIEDQQAKRSPILIGVWSVFMKIVNNGGGDDALVSARVNIPHAAAELHDVKDGKMASSSYIPVTMTDEAYIDVFDKKTLKLKHRVFLDYKPGETKFFHGTNTPDMKKFLVAVNLQSDGKPNGKIDLIMLDMKALESGKAKVLAKNTVTGEPGKTITFRQYFTNDGRYLLQSARDRMLLIDAKTLKVLDEEMVTGENHDVMPTPDGNFAVLTLRTVVNKTADAKDVLDGTMQLYDIKTKKLVGSPSSACKKCHDGAGITASAVLCGIDGNWKKAAK